MRHARQLPRKRNPGRPSRPLPKPERQLNPRSRRMRDGRRDPVDPSRDRLSFQRRLERSLVDVGLYRSVSFRDLAEAHFDDHPYVARRGRQPVDPRGSFQGNYGPGPQGQCLQGAHRHPRRRRAGPPASCRGRGSTPGSGPGPAWSSPANSPMTPRSTGRPGRRSSASSPKDLPSAASGSMPN